ncbi:MAG: exonuclease domain-containing protein [Ruminococcus sp.]
MSFVIFDLEWNSSFSKKKMKYINEIFEIGAIKFDEDFNVTGTFESFVRPQIAFELNPYVERLTGITFEEIKSAPYQYPTVIKQFEEFIGESVVMTWSTSDLNALIENHNYFLESKTVSFLKRYCDLQSYSEYISGVGSYNRHISLVDFANLVGVDTTGERHRALSDAKLSLECFKKIYKTEVFEEFVEDATAPEYLNRLTFKTKVITDLHSPQIEHSKMYFDCPDCNVRCIKKSKWKSNNKCFKAYFVCPKCKKEYAGQIYVKQKYEGVVFSKKLSLQSYAKQAEISPFASEGKM